MLTAFLQAYLLAVGYLNREEYFLRFNCSFSVSCEKLLIHRDSPPALCRARRGQWWMSEHLGWRMERDIYDRTFRLHKSFLIWYQFSFSTHFRCSNKSGFSQLYFDHHVYQMYIMDYISVHICIRTDERDLSKSSFLHLIKAETLVEFISSISTQVPLSPFHSLHSNMLHKKPLKRQTTSQK